MKCLIRFIGVQSVDFSYLISVTETKMGPDYLETAVLCRKRTIKRKQTKGLTE